MPAEQSPEERPPLCLKPSHYTYRVQGSTLPLVVQVCGICGQQQAAWPFWERLARIYQSEGWEKAEEYLERGRDA